MYRVHTSQSVQEIEFKDETAFINGTSAAFDILKTGASTYHILLNNKSYNAKLISINRNEKRVVLELEGRTIDITVEDAFDELLIKMGIDKDAQNKISEIKAPMPGLVLSVNVKAGDEVAEGDALVVLEAMKMENVLNAPSNAVVKSVEVKSGQKVDKNDILVTFE